MDILVYYPFGGNPTIQIYGNFGGIPLLQGIVWDGNIMTPVSMKFSWLVLMTGSL